VIRSASRRRCRSNALMSRRLKTFAIQTVEDGGYVGVMRTAARIEDPSAGYRMTWERLSSVKATQTHRYA